MRDKSTTPASPWQNGFAERLIGSIRRECADHFVVLLCAGFCEPMLAITMTSGRTGHWTKMLQSLVPVSGLESLAYARSFADFITITHSPLRRLKSAVDQKLLDFSLTETSLALCQ